MSSDVVYPLGEGEMAEEMISKNKEMGPWNYKRFGDIILPLYLVIEMVLTVFPGMNLYSATTWSFYGVMITFMLVKGTQWLYMAVYAKYLHIGKGETVIYNEDVKRAYRNFFAMITLELGVMGFLLLGWLRRHSDFVPTDFRSAHFGYGNNDPYKKTLPGNPFAAADNNGYKELRYVSLTYVVFSFATIMTKLQFMWTMNKQSYTVTYKQDVAGEEWKKRWYYLAGLALYMAGIIHGVLLLTEVVGKAKHVPMWVYFMFLSFEILMFLLLLFLHKTTTRIVTGAHYTLSSALIYWAGLIALQIYLLFGITVGYGIAMRSAAPTISPTLTAHQFQAVAVFSDYTVLMVASLGFTTFFGVSHFILSKDSKMMELFSDKELTETATRTPAKTGFVVYWMLSALYLLALYVFQLGELDNWHYLLHPTRFYRFIIIYTAITLTFVAIGWIFVIAKMSTHAKKYKVSQIIAGMDFRISHPRFITVFTVVYIINVSLYWLEFRDFGEGQFTLANINNNTEKYQNTWYNVWDIAVISNIPLLFAIVDIASQTNAIFFIKRNA